jgi:molybdopterin molybdotransferase
MTNKRQTSCADTFETDAISVDKARDIITQKTTPITKSEKLGLRSCLDRYLAEDIYSPIDVPSHTNSAMDGYAIAGDDLPIKTEQRYSVSGISYAGKPSTNAHKSGHVTRIMTGAVMPKGTDTVIMQEQIEIVDKLNILIKPEHKKGQNVRQAGEDIAKDCLVLSKGRKITPADLGILASLGISELKVFSRPRIAFFSTGDELRAVGEKLKEGEIYDSNRYTLYGMLKQLEVDITDLGVVQDTKNAIHDAFVKASEIADIVITSGGVSVGDADFIKPTLKALGDTYFWKISMKPGRPLTFGRIDDALFFGLPGNPVAVMVTFMQFLEPAIHYLSSGVIKAPITLQAISADQISKRSGRTEFQRGIFEQTPNGELTVKRTGKQGSGILTSMSIANCFIVLPEDSNGIEEGEMVKIQPFSGAV